MDDYRVIRDMKLAAPSTISGWRKAGSHPQWVDVILEQRRTIEAQERYIEEQRTTIRVLTNMVK